jgi:hypothetical protein
MPNVMGELTDDEVHDRFIRRCLRKIIEHAQDGRGGSISYAMDRLTQIEKVAKIALEK